MIYYPTDEDEAVAEQYGKDAVQAARAGNCEDYPPYDYSPRGHQLNALGQIAFCKLFGLDVALNPNSAAEPTVYKINDKTIGVKCIDNPNHNLALSQRKKSYAQIYVLMYRNMNAGVEYRGWATKEEIENSGWETGGDTWLLGKHRLHGGRPNEK